MKARKMRLNHKFNNLELCDICHHFQNWFEEKVCNEKFMQVRGLKPIVNITILEAQKFMQVKGLKPIVNSTILKL